LLQGGNLLWPEGIQMPGWGSLWLCSLLGKLGLQLIPPRPELLELLERRLQLGA
jgi:hypothetical protein